MEIRTNPNTGEVAVKLNKSERRWLAASMSIADTCSRLADESVSQPALEAYRGLKQFIASCPVPVTKPEKGANE